MNAEQYSVLALRFAADRSQKQKQLEAAMGIGGEGGEIVDIIKKNIFYDKPLDRLHALEELGDLVWYINLMIHSLESDWDQVFTMNMLKLEARYPNMGFNPDHAINRDTVAEQIAMALAGPVAK